MDDLTSKAIEAIKARVGEEPYARQMGFKLVQLEPGHAVIEMALREESDNMFGAPHGGAIYSLIDEAFEASSNSHGTVAVALNCNVSYLKAAKTGEVLRAESRELSRSRRISTYFIEVRDAEGQLIATCNAMAYQRLDPLPFLPG